MRRFKLSGFLCLFLCAVMAFAACASKDGGSKKEKATGTPTASVTEAVTPSEEPTAEPTEEPTPTPCESGRLVTAKKGEQALLCSEGADGVQKWIIKGK